MVIDPITYAQMQPCIFTFRGVINNNKHTCEVGSKLHRCLKATALRQYKSCLKFLAMLEVEANLDEKANLQARTPFCRLSGHCPGQFLAMKKQTCRQEPLFCRLSGHCPGQFPGAKIFNLQEKSIPGKNKGLFGSMFFCVSGHDMIIKGVTIDLPTWSSIHKTNHGDMKHIQPCAAGFLNSALGCWRKTHQMHLSVLTGWLDILKLHCWTISRTCQNS